MNPKRVQSFITLVLLILLAFQLVHYYPMLPKVMPGKYDASGNPVSMMSKESFIALYAGTYIFLLFIFVGVGVFARKLPASLINVPNRDYWFSEEHRAEGADRLGLMMLRFSNITSLLMIVFLQFILDQVMTGAKFSQKFWWLMGIYLVYTVAWCIQLCMKFKKPAE